MSHVIPRLVVLLGPVLALAALASTGYAAGGNVPFCTAATGCAATSCKIDCSGGTASETHLRNAIAVANSCVSTANFERTIYFREHTGVCVVNLEQTSSSPTGCNSDPEGRTICITGKNITIDGENAVLFNYAGTQTCLDCDGSCSSSTHALFTLKGENNALKNFEYQYFPEGIHIRAGDNHLISGVGTERICEDALTIDNGAGVGILVEGSTFRGRVNDSNCFSEDKPDGICGLDKAIQILGGSSEVTSSTFDDVLRPVDVLGGFVDVNENAISGDPSEPVFCHALTAGRDGQMYAHDNTIEDCRFGIRAEGLQGVGGEIYAYDNTIKNGHDSCLMAKENGRLVAASNRMKNCNRAGGNNTGALLTEPSTGRFPQIDAGGGSCSSGGVILVGTTLLQIVNNAPSPGDNLICQDAANPGDRRRDIWRGGGASTCVRAEENDFDIDGWGPSGTFLFPKTEPEQCQQNPGSCANHPDVDPFTIVTANPNCNF